jgi:hypothetical protein
MAAAQPVDVNLRVLPIVAGSPRREQGWIRMSHGAIDGDA